MNIRAAFASLLSAVPIPRRGVAAARLMRTVLLLLIAQYAMLPTAIAAEQTKTIVKIDGKTVFIPEVTLTKRVIPVTTVLFIGSWKSTPKTTGDPEPLCALDLNNNRLLLSSPDKLLPNSKTWVADRNTLNPFLDGMTWGKRQATHFAFKVISDRSQPAVIELYTDSDAIMFNNGNIASRVRAGKVADAGGRGYLPIMLDEGENIINIKQYSTGEPRIQATLYFDHSRDLKAAWQTHSGLLKSLFTLSGERSNIPELAWNQYLGNFSVSMEVRDVSTNTVVFKRDSVRQGRLFNDESKNFAPGIYEAVYRKGNDSASEFFVVGNPQDLFAELQDKLSKYNPDSESKLDIEAQLRRARILLAKDNYNIFDRKWQEKAAYTFSCLATFARRLKEGATNIAKDQTGLHIRGFASNADDSFQSYRLFIPSKYNPDVPLPLLVIASTSIANATRPFIEGPVMADYHGALLWAKYAEKHGFALLWPGYRGGSPKGYTYESMHINDAIQAVEKDYNIDKQRISVYATCGAGYFAGRLISEYENRFAAIVYDRAVFDFPPSDLAQPDPSLVEWLKAASPVPHVLGNRNLKLFVMHDDTKPPGHGPLQLTTQFLAQARETRDDIVTLLSKQPMTEASRMDRVFSWLTPCRNENSNDARSHYLAKAGYTGPIMEIFATPIIVVVGSHAPENLKKNMEDIAGSLKGDYTKYFHGAECAIKKDDDVTEEDIKNNSLILIGNPTINNVWGKLQPRIALEVALDKVLYENKTLAGNSMFEAIARHPDTANKYILLIGTGDFQKLKPVITDNLFNAWYDCLVFDTPFRIISKLDVRAEARSGR